MVDYESELNDEQRRVVMVDGGPMLVIAGAGSGKTRTLTYRVARLIESGIRPGEILLATFTNKAARSMLTRVKSLVDKDIGDLWGGTFHHIAHRMLRLRCHLLGYENNFSIMDSDDAEQMVKACLSEMGIESKGDRFPKGSIISDAISLSVNTETPVEEVVRHRYPHFSHCVDDISRVAARYHHRKKSLNMMDFDDLLYNCLKILAEFPDVLAAYSQRFFHVLVDEYQDTSLIQAELVDLLACRHKNLMVVGDDSQSIYSFRGANFENIMHFPDKYPDCRIFKLETNYRSTPEILHLANLSIVNNERQFQKVLVPTKTEGIRPILATTRNVVHQADFAAQRIIELIRSGVSPHEIAVLYRAHYHSMELQMEMVRRGIPFEIRSGIRFFEQAHIKDVTAYLRILVNPLDELAWRRILLLISGVGKVTAKKIWTFLAAQEAPLEAVRTEAFLKAGPAGARAGLKEMQITMTHLIDEQAVDDPGRIIEAILTRGYRLCLQERYIDAASREDDIIQLAHFSEKFASLDDLLGELALLSSMTEDDGRQPEESENKVVLTTIHQAKGLEWSAVFILWCADGMIPLARALKDAGGEEEERRLFYVAMTRAKDQLYLCCPVIDYTRGMGNMPLRISRFITELSSPLSQADRRPYDVWQVDDDDD